MIIITGASKGIGRYLFNEFTNNGFDVLGTYFATPQADLGGANRYHKVDIRDFHEVDSWIDSLSDCLKEVVLVNCAGTSYNAYAHKSDATLWKNVIDLNLVGTYNVIRRLLPIMREQNYGRIINFSSVVSKFPTPGVSAYAASKAGLNGLTKSLAIENASKGITVNSINLGYVNLGMGIEQVPAEYQAKMKTRIPAGRFCEPIEIYQTIEYLIKTEYVNGSCIDINGALI
jgi:NAD(P)-dependent dehydrogenase (short-subunit alcohol dehydrogenase family)